jgi:hypothetical protein
MGRLKAHGLGLGSQGQLGLRLSRPARAVGWLGVLGRLGLQSITGGSSWALLVLGPWRQAAIYLRLLLLARLGCFVAFSSRLGLLLLAGWRRLLFFSSLVGRAQVAVSAGSGAAGWIRCGRRARACVRATRARAGTDVQMVFAAPACGHRARQRRGGAVVWRRWWGEEWVRQSEGRGRRAAARLGLAVRVRTHAHGSWSSRAAAWPCHRHPEPVARRGGEGDGVCGGLVAARRDPAQERR